MNKMKPYLLISFIVVFLWFAFFVSLNSPLYAQEVKVIPALSISYFPLTSCNATLLNKIPLQNPSFQDQSGSFFTGPIDGSATSGKWGVTSNLNTASFNLRFGTAQSYGVRLYFWSVDRPERFTIKAYKDSALVATLTEEYSLTGYTRLTGTSSPIDYKDYIFPSMKEVNRVEFTTDDYRDTGPANSTQINLYEIELYSNFSSQQCLDSTKTGLSLTYESIKTRVNALMVETETTLEEGSRYKGYKNTSAQKYLDYQIIEHKEFLTPIPRSNNQVPWNPGSYRPDYNKILTDLNICNYVENLGVKQVWMWGYHYGDIEPNESNMAGPYGDISNSQRIPDMPVCTKTYVLYNYNYEREAGSAVHDHMHQFENIFDYLDPAGGLFWGLFVRPYGDTTKVNNCGWTHMPPNTTVSYNYGNNTLLPTRCEDWKPDQTGTVQNLSCTRWGCTEIGFFRWWMQNMPGKNNGLSYQGKPLRNWWDATYDFDEFVKGGRSLVYINGLPTLTPTISLPPTSTPTKTPTFTPTRTPTPLPVPGDITGDNHITLADLSIVLANFGKSGTKSQGDVNGSGTINLQDLSIILSNFGK